MTTEADKEYRREALYTLGVAESIVQRIESLRADDASRNWGDVGDMKYVFAQLREIEDRLYSKGEYAPENVASVKGGAR